jgi:translation elongation factor P/translation initiation factor 5A
MSDWHTIDNFKVGDKISSHAKIVYEIVSFEYIKVKNKQVKNRVKIKNIETGKPFDFTINSTDKFYLYEQ